MNNLEIENDKNMEMTNKLLIELIRNQKQNTKDMLKMFIITVISMTIILLGTVIGFLVYEDGNRPPMVNPDSYIEQDAQSGDCKDIFCNMKGVYIV